ncbi:hypothetical protein ALC57_06877 [Trachymyrmex cornetzi]|uniref:Uncharacterized protein n=1 Tax=Trachymyrmex cornetzi TaxID=471704 RepID=A0A195E817_9HYME|nr:hypothetical protein ALC57_06877 [Trachymyrmex cornetzi]
MPVDTPPISEHQLCSTPSLCSTLVARLRTILKSNGPRHAATISIPRLPNLRDQFNTQYGRSGGTMGAFLPGVTYPRGGRPIVKKEDEIRLGSNVEDVVSPWLIVTVRRRDGEGGKGGGKEGGRKEGEEEEMPTEAVAAAAVTSRLVFLITPDPGRAEEEELLSDVSIMTRLCTEVRITKRSCAYARAEQKQSDFEKAKGSVDEGRPVYESKKRVAARPYDGTGREGVVGDGRREREDRIAWWTRDNVDMYKSNAHAVTACIHCVSDPSDLVSGISYKKLANAWLAVSLDG